MGFIDNIALNRKRKQDAKLIEQIKHKGNEPNTIYDLIKKLQLEESRMQIFRIFDESNIFDRFKNKDKISNILENPYNIFEILESDENKYELLQYFNKYGIDEVFINECIGETYKSGKQRLLQEMTTQDYKEKSLEIIYNYMDYDNEQDLEEYIIEILNKMEPEVRTEFLNSHSFSNRNAIRLYKKYDEENLVEKSETEIGEYLSSAESVNILNGISEKQAQRMIDLYENSMSSSNLAECVETIHSSPEELKAILNNHYEQLKSEMNRIFARKTIWKNDYEMIEMFINDFSKDIDEETLDKVFKNYNESLKRLKSKSEISEDEQKFIEHDEQEPRFLYNMTSKYYNEKTQDEHFKATLVNKVLSNLSLLDRLDFIKIYKEKIEMQELNGISQEVIGHELNIRDFLLEYQDIIPTQDITNIINSVPIKERVELMKICNISEEQKGEIIEYAQNENIGNTTFLELAVTKAELEKMSSTKGTEIGEISKEDNIIPKNEGIGTIE